MGTTCFRDRKDLLHAMRRVLTIEAFQLESISLCGPCNGFSGIAKSEGCHLDCGSSVECHSFPPSEIMAVMPRPLSHNETMQLSVSGKDILSLVVGHAKVVTLIYEIIDELALGKGCKKDDVCILLVSGFCVPKRKHGIAYSFSGANRTRIWYEFPEKCGNTEGRHRFTSLNENATSVSAQEEGSSRGH